MAFDDRSNARGQVRGIYHTRPLELSDNNLHDKVLISNTPLANDIFYHILRVTKIYLPYIIFITIVGFGSLIHNNFQLTPNGQHPRAIKLCKYLENNACKKLVENNWKSVKIFQSHFTYILLPLRLLVRSNFSYRLLHTTSFTVLSYKAGVQNILKVHN